MTYRRTLHIPGDHSYIAFYTSMFARLSQLSRHLSPPLPRFSAAPASSAFLGTNIMTSITAAEKSKRMIHTAGCIIIGDEVLGGKVCPNTKIDVEIPSS